MTKRLMIACALLTSTAFAQNVRYEGNVTTVSGNAPAGASSPVITVPNAIVTLCTYPGVGNPCTNTVPIFNDIAGTSPTANPLSTDQRGRYGLWVAPGIYSESIQSASGAVLGSYTLSLNNTGISATPISDQVITQPSLTALRVNNACVGPGPVNAKSCFNAQGNLQATSCLIAAGSTSLTCTAAFVAADAGKTIYIAGAGTSGTSYSGTIASVSPVAPATTTNTVTLSAAASTAVASATTIYATDDTAALQQAYNSAISTGAALYIPAGAYLHHGLNWTGMNGSRIFGDGYNRTDLYAIAVNNPGGTSGATQVGIDVSNSSGGQLADLALFGGYNVTGLFVDLAPTVNLFGGRVNNSGGTQLSIKHSFDRIYTETSGAYDVVLYGYEQTHFTNSHFQTDNASNAKALLYLSAVNSPGFVSPYVTIIPVTTLTKVTISGAGTEFQGYGSHIVLDDVGTNGMYQLAIRDAYAYMNGAGADGTCSFIKDTAPTGSTNYLRDIVLDTVYIETSSTSCQVVNVNEIAYQWRISEVQKYPTSNLTLPEYSFNGGFLNSYASIDSSGLPNVPNLLAPSCAGSSLNIGYLETPISCSDYSSYATPAGYMQGFQKNGTGVRPYNVTAYTTATWVKLGTWVGAYSGDTIHISVDISGGKLPAGNQQAMVEIAAAIANTSTAPNVTGITAWELGTTAPVSALQIIATGGSVLPTNDSWDVWVQVQSYAFGTYHVVVSDGGTWTNLQTVGTPPTGAYVVPGNVYSVSTTPPGTTGASKTCTTYPTVVNGIVTSC